MDWQPSPEDVAALGDVAQAWLAAVLATWRFDSEIEGRRLMLALESLDRADQLKRALQAEGVGAERRAASGARSGACGSSPRSGRNSAWAGLNGDNTNTVGVAARSH